MDIIKPVKLRYIHGGTVSAEAFNRLIDVLNAMNDRVYELETRAFQVGGVDVRRVHVRDDRQVQPE